MTEEMHDELSEESPVHNEEGTDETPGADRTNNALVIVALLAVIAVLVAGFFVVKELTGQRAPATMAEAKIATLEAQVAENPADPNLRLRLVDAYYAIKDYDEAKYHLDEMRSQEVTGTVFAMVLYADGKVEQARGNNDEAVELYLESLELFDYPDTRYALAELYLSVEQWDDAIENYDIYLQTFPTDSGGLVRLGRAYEGKGDFEKALELYKQALTYIPDDPNIVADIARLEGR